METIDNIIIRPRSMGCIWVCSALKSNIDVEVDSGKLYTATVSMQFNGSARSGDLKV